MMKGLDFVERTVIATNYAEPQLISAYNRWIDLKLLITKDVPVFVSSPKMYLRRPSS